MSALILSGGGARGAFQAGVIKALIEIAGEEKIARPFPIVSGISAGAINAAYYASACDDLPTAAARLADFWGALRTNRIFHSDWSSIGRIGFTWTWDILFGGLSKKARIKSLLDTAPLRKVLKENVPIENIRRNIDAGHIRAVEVSATSYANSDIVSFVQAFEQSVHWHRSKRHSEHTQLSIEHVMASAALPLFFPPVKIGKQYFGDGCLRNASPLSPAIRLGARKLLIVGVRKYQPDQVARDAETIVNPTIARILSVILNAILLDAVEFDLERLQRINKTVSLIPPENLAKTPLERIDYLYIRPSEDIGDVAAAQFSRLPSTLRYLIDGIGNHREASELVSYLLFDPKYCTHLVNLGYADTMRERERVVDFFHK